MKPILEFPTPVRKDELQRFLGCVTYYSGFLPGLAEILAPLHGAVGNKAKDKKAILDWTPQCQSAFETAKKKLAAAALLHHLSPSAETRITTDASGTAVGGQLEQRSKEGWVPLAFFSKKMSKAECKYSAFDRELLAIFLTIKTLAPFS